MSREALRASREDDKGGGSQTQKPDPIRTDDAEVAAAECDESTPSAGPHSAGTGGGGQHVKPVRSDDDAGGDR